MNELFIILVALLVVVLIINSGCEEIEHFQKKIPPKAPPPPAKAPVKSAWEIAFDNQTIALEQAQIATNEAVAGKNLSAQSITNVYNSVEGIAKNAVLNIGDNPSLAREKSYNVAKLPAIDKANKELTDARSIIYTEVKNYATTQSNNKINELNIKIQENKSAVLTAAMNVIDTLISQNASIQTIKNSIDSALNRAAPTIKKNEIISELTNEVNTAYNAANLIESNIQINPQDANNIILNIKSKAMDEINNVSNFNNDSINRIINNIKLNANNEIQTLKTYLKKKIADSQALEAAAAKSALESENLRKAQEDRNAEVSRQVEADRIGNAARKLKIKEEQLEEYRQQVIRNENEYKSYLANLGPECSGIALQYEKCQEQERQDATQAATQAAAQDKTINVVDAAQIYYERRLEEARQQSKAIADNKRETLEAEAKTQAINEGKEAEYKEKVRIENERIANEVFQKEVERQKALAANRSLPPDSQWCRDYDTPWYAWEFCKSEISKKTCPSMCKNAKPYVQARPPNYDVFNCGRVLSGVDKNNERIEEDLRKESCYTKNTKQKCGGMCYDQGYRWDPVSFGSI